MTRPLTLTRPCRIHSSASRREHSPARAISLAMRSPAFLAFAGAGSALAPAKIPIRLAFAIFAAPAERRPLLVGALASLVAAFAPRMLAPGVAGARDPVVARAILSRPIALRTLVAIAREARAVRAGPGIPAVIARFAAERPVAARPVVALESPADGHRRAEVAARWPIAVTLEVARAADDRRPRVEVRARADDRRRA